MPGAQLLLLLLLCNHRHLLMQSRAQLTASNSSVRAACRTMQRQQHGLLQALQQWPPPLSLAQGPLLYQSRQQRRLRQRQLLTSWAASLCSRHQPRCPAPAAAASRPHAQAAPLLRQRRGRWPPLPQHHRRRLLRPSQCHRRNCPRRAQQHRGSSQKALQQHKSRRQGVPSKQQQQQVLTP